MIQQSNEIVKALRYDNSCKIPCKTDYVVLSGTNFNIFFKVLSENEL